MLGFSPGGGALNGYKATGLGVLLSGLNGFQSEEGPFVCPSGGVQGDEEGEEEEGEGIFD